MILLVTIDLINSILENQDLFNPYISYQDVFLNLIFTLLI